jgi:hypothetical protein
VANGEVEAASQRLEEVRTELRAIPWDKHPDAWLERHGGEVADLLAVKECFRWRENALANEAARRDAPPGERTDELMSAVAEPSLLEPQHVAYEGRLRWNGWRAGLRTLQRDDNGVETPKLPEPYATALGAARTTGIQSLARGRLTRQAWQPVTPEDLSAQARKLGRALGALDLEMSTQVVAIEAERRELFKRWVDAGRKYAGRARQHTDAVFAEVAAVRQRRTEVDWKLRGLVRNKRHPDRWVERWGADVADALAARQRIALERKLAAEAAEREAAWQNFLHEVAAEAPGQGAELSGSPQDGREVHASVESAPAIGPGLEPF